MAYSRRSRRFRRRPSRRTPRRTRTIRRRTTTRRRTGVSRRRLLNITSKKKQDNRLTFSNVDTPGSAPTLKNIIMTGGATYMIPHIPTAMDRTVGSTTPDVPGYRESTTIFARGYRERISIGTNTPAAWSLRRICFRLKGNAIINSATTNTPLWLETSPNGFVRSATNAMGTALGTAILGEIFKGEINVDWNNYFTAPIDTNRVSLAYDKQFHFRSQNDSPHNHHFKLWHPMNKNLMYRDDENGESTTTSPLSTSGNAGMGDYYIVDFWNCTTTTTDNTIGLQYEGTLYWHER